MRVVAVALLTGACAPAVTLPEVVQVRAPTRSQAIGELVLRCTPDDAEVALDGVSQGLCSDFDGAPRSLKVGTRSRRVEVKKRGFETWESWLAADQTRVVMTVTLVPSGDER